MNIVQKKKIANRGARLAAIQNRYILLIDPLSENILQEAVLKEDDLKQGYISAETDQKLLDDLTCFLQQKQNYIAEKLKKTLKRHKVENLLQAIIEIGFCEICLKPSDFALIIDEYCNLTGVFYQTNSEIGLVNAVLQNLFNSLNDEQKKNADA